MKLMVPFAGIVFASGICCCGDFVEGIKTGVEEGMKQAGQDVTVTVGDGGTTATTGTTTVSTGGGGLVAVDGACGKFKTMGVQGPAGFSIMACSDTGNSAALVLQGSGDPVELCKPIKTWVESAGYNVTMNAAMGGTSSIVSQKGTERLVIACTNQTGPTLVSYSLSAD
jgi:hypothetical protein